MGFEAGHAGRLRSLERALQPSGTVAVVITSAMTPEQVAAAERLAAQAQAKGRELVVVSIRFEARPAAPANAPERPPAPEP